MPVVDYPQAPTLAAALSGPAELAKAAGAPNQVAAFGICHQRPLQGSQFFIGQEVSRLPSEERSFLESDTHA